MVTIFRADDVGANTDMEKLFRMYEHIQKEFGCTFWSAVSLFSKRTNDGSVYPGAPFKNNPHDFFYNVDLFSFKNAYPGKVVSHGLIHADHSKLQYDAQEMSIVASCNFLKTSTFVPPFNKFNGTTEAVCRINKIELVKFHDGWKSLDVEDFDPSHKFWYFHPWRFSLQAFKDKLNVALSLSRKCS